MKKIIPFVIIFCFTECYTQTIVSPQFSELNGMEDQSSNTHLFYRIYSYFSNDPIFQWHNDIYHLDVYTGVDTLFITAFGIESPGYNFNKWVSDVDFWNDNPAEFIYCGGTSGGPFVEGGPYVVRFDGVSAPFPAFHGSANYIDISSSDDSLLYLGVFMTDYIYNERRTFRSTDGGWNWEMITDSFQFQSLYPLNDNIMFAVDGYNSKLMKSSNAGNSFYLVDPEENMESSFIYDNDGIHIYRLINGKLKVSDNLGEQFSWEEKYFSENSIYISVDYSISGTIYLANKKNIYLSTDYGENFNLYKSLDRKIVGIYKKPNSNKLYAATKYKIYEITPDTMNVIKCLPIPDEVLNYYPLAIGNKWVYDKYTHIEWNTYHDIFIREVVGDSLLPNGKRFFHLNEYVVGSLFGQTNFERIDSSEGKIYRYDDNLGLQDDEYVIDDLLADVGDTVQSYRMEYWENGYTTVLDEITFEKWGITKLKKVFEQYILHPPVYSLTQEIGLDSIFSYFDFGETRVILKGCIIDGIVYGDTTVVSVEDEEPILPFEFELAQNYPNPFNSITKIKYKIAGNPPAPYPHNIPPPKIKSYSVILIIYDILGMEITTLINEEKPAGSYEVEFDGTELTSGIYFYQLRAGNFIETKKMLLIK